MRIGILFLSVLSVFFFSPAFADEFDQCIAKKEAEYKKQEPFVKTGGCRSGGTRITGERRSCSETVCYKAHPDYAIVSNVKIRSTSAAGSEHRFSSPDYKFSPDGRLGKVCVSVHARSPSGNHGARGWQRIEMTGTVEKFLDESATKEIAKSCAIEVYGR
jgi:hypothetical protein